MAPTPYAGVISRAIALAIDVLVINLAAAVLGAAIGLIGSLAGIGDLGIVAAVTGGFLWLAWTALYFVVFWMIAGQTPGARMLGIRVVCTGGRRLGPIRAILRFAAMAAALTPLGVGFLTVLFDERRRGPHDMIAGTVVRWATPDPTVPLPGETQALPGDADAAAELLDEQRSGDPRALAADQPPATRPKHLPTT